MIKLKDLTPEIYYKESRDFQFIGRLFDVVLNSVKTEADLLYSMPINDNSNEQLLDLMALTLGFKPRHQYDTKQLRAICKVFPEIIKHKGSIKSILIACSALFNAAGAEQTLDYDFTKNSNNTELNLYVPQDFGDVTIITDLLTYTLPAGMSCNIIRELRLSTSSITELETTDRFTIYTNGDNADINNKNNYLYSNKMMSQLVRLKSGKSAETDIASGILSTGDAIKSLITDKPGFIMNSALYVDPSLKEVVEDTENTEDMGDNNNG